MMNGGHRIAALVGLSTLMGIGPAVAHHSFAMFDMTKSVRLEGTVQRFEWTNPHSWIFLEVAGQGTTSEQWTIELPSAGALAREGWNKNYLRVGERVVLHVNPLKDGRKGGNLESFTPPSKGPLDRSAVSSAHPADAPHRTSGIQN
jgi:hypothetical protein